MRTARPIAKVASFRIKSFAPPALSIERRPNCHHRVYAENVKRVAQLHETSQVSDILLGDDIAFAAAAERVAERDTIRQVINEQTAMEKVS